MFRKNKEPQSINFLDSLYANTDIWGNLYLWLVNIGKYLLIAVQIVVLGVFFSRFVLDRRNNDLTKEINNKVVLLSNESWQRNAILFDNYQTLFSDVALIRDGQEINSDKVSQLLSGIPRTLNLRSFSYREGRVSLNISSVSLDTVRNYETALKADPELDDVRFRITKEDAMINVGVSFNLK